MTIFFICACVFLVLVEVVFIYKVNNHYDGLIAENEKKYTDHINDWYYEIVKTEDE